MHLVVSVRRPADLYYEPELQGPAVTVIYTRQAPVGYARAVAHIALGDVAPVSVPGATAYVCGSSPFADAATDLLMASGVDAPHIRVERFGPSG